MLLGVIRGKIGKPKQKKVQRCRKDITYCRLEIVGRLLKKLCTSVAGETVNKYNSHLGLALPMSIRVKLLFSGPSEHIDGPASVVQSVPYQTAELEATCPVSQNHSGYTRMPGPWRAIIDDWREEMVV